ncbi:actin organization and endocytosis protein [Phlyctochytrium planicorne]|nr:actin organization and endocytosis protein [Phlyctochytrium planicorne]
MLLANQSLEPPAMPPRPDTPPTSPGLVKLSDRSPMPLTTSPNLKPIVPEVGRQRSSSDAKLPSAGKGSTFTPPPKGPPSVSISNADDGEKPLWATAALKPSELRKMESGGDVVAESVVRPSQVAKGLGIITPVSKPAVAMKPSELKSSEKSPKEALNAINGLNSTGLPKPWEVEAAAAAVDSRVSETELPKSSTAIAKAKLWESASPNNGKIEQTRPSSTEPPRESIGKAPLASTGKPKPWEIDEAELKALSNEVEKNNKALEAEWSKSSTAAAKAKLWDSTAPVIVAKPVELRSSSTEPPSTTAGLSSTGKPKPWEIEEAERASVGAMGLNSTGKIKPWEADKSAAAAFSSRSSSTEPPKVSTTTSATAAAKAKLWDSSAPAPNAVKLPTSRSSSTEPPTSGLAATGKPKPWEIEEAERAKFGNMGLSSTGKVKPWELDAAERSHFNGSTVDGFGGGEMMRLKGDSDDDEEEEEEELQLLKPSLLRSSSAGSTEAPKAKPWAADLLAASRSSSTSGSPVVSPAKKRPVPPPPPTSKPDVKARLSMIVDGKRPPPPPPPSKAVGSPRGSPASPVSSSPSLAKASPPVPPPSKAVRNRPAPPPPPASKIACPIAPEPKSWYDEAFDRYDQDRDGYLSGKEVRSIWLRSRLDGVSLGMIWLLVDGRREFRLNREEFSVGMHLIDERLRGRPIPAVLGKDLEAYLAASRRR